MMLLGDRVARARPRPSAARRSTARRTARAGLGRCARRNPSAVTRTIVFGAVSHVDERRPGGVLAPRASGIAARACAADCGAVGGVVRGQRGVDLGVAGRAAGDERDRAAPSAGRCRSRGPASVDRPVAQRRARSSTCAGVLGDGGEGLDELELRVAAGLGGLGERPERVADRGDASRRGARGRRTCFAASDSWPSTVRSVVDSVSVAMLPSTRSTKSRGEVSASRVASQAEPHTSERASGLSMRGEVLDGDRRARPRRGGSSRRRGRRR